MSEGINDVPIVLEVESHDLLEQEGGHVGQDIHHHLLVGEDEDNRHHKDAVK